MAHSPEEINPSLGNIGIPSPSFAGTPDGALYPRPAVVGPVPFVPPTDAHERAEVPALASGFGDKVASDSQTPPVVYQAAAEPPEQAQTDPEQPTTPETPVATPTTPRVKSARELTIEENRAEAARRRTDRRMRINWSAVRTDRGATLSERAQSVLDAVRGGVGPRDVSILFTGVRGALGRAYRQEPPIILDGKIPPKIASALYHNQIMPEEVPGVTLLSRFSELPPSVPIEQVLQNFDIQVGPPDVDRLPVKPHLIWRNSLVTVHMGADIVDPNGKKRARMDRRFTIYSPRQGAKPAVGESPVYQRHYSPETLREARSILRVSLYSARSSQWAPALLEVIGEYAQPFNTAAAREARAVDRAYLGGLPGRDRKKH